MTTAGDGKPAATLTVKIGNDTLLGVFVR